jgi:hypothetical protein
MIDFAKIRERLTVWAVVKEIIANGLQLFLILYGLKCILFLHGKMLVSVRGAVYNHLELRPVSGTVAFMTGLMYFSFGSFIYLSYGQPPAEKRGWLWRMGRAVLRWGTLVATIFAFTQLPDHGLPDWDSALLLLQIVGYIAGVIALISFLLAMYQREQVKRELNAQDCQPLHVWWRPAAYWLPWPAYMSATGFRVVYLDSNGSTHKGYCLVYRSFSRDWQWGNRDVEWLTDTITDAPRAAEVWADSEILRPRLPGWDSSSEGNNPLKNPDELE